MTRRMKKEGTSLPVRILLFLFSAPVLIVAIVGFVVYTAFDIHVQKGEARECLDRAEVRYAADGDIFDLKLLQGLRLEFHSVGYPHLWGRYANTDGGPSASSFCARADTIGKLGH